MTQRAMTSPVGNKISESYWQKTKLMGEGEDVGSKWRGERE